MSLTSRSPIHVEGSTQSPVMTKIPNTTSRGGYSQPSRSSSRHAGVVKKLRGVFAAIQGDQTRDVSFLPRVSVEDLGRALSSFLVEARHGRQGELPLGDTSSTRRGHFMDSRDPGRKTRAEREDDTRKRVQANKLIRDAKKLKKHHS